jgi:hypothetical protein
MKKHHLYIVAAVGAYLWYKQTKATTKAAQTTAPAAHSMTLVDMLEGTHA